MSSTKRRPARGSDEETDEACRCGLADVARQVAETEVPGHIRLYHCTSAESADSILSHGFRDGPRGGVWLAESTREVLGESEWGCILEVSLSQTDKLLPTLQHIVEDEEEWDTTAKQWVPAREKEWEGSRYYCVPAVYLNAHATVRLIPTRDLAARIGDKALAAPGEG